MAVPLRRAVFCLVTVCTLVTVLLFCVMFVPGPVKDWRSNLPALKTELHVVEDEDGDDNNHPSAGALAHGPFEDNLEAVFHVRGSSISRERRPGAELSRDGVAENLVQHPNTAPSTGIPLNLGVKSSYVASNTLSYRTVGSQVSSQRNKEGSHLPHLSSNGNPAYANQAQGYGYVLALSTPGQQGAGLRSLFSLQCAIGSHRLPMYVVQPFIVNSSVSSLPKTGRRPLSLQDFYDIAHYNRVSREQGWAEIVSWEEFVHNSRKPVIYVEAQKVTGSIAFCFTNVTKSPVPPVVKCSSREQCEKMYRSSVRQILRLTQSPYVVRVVYVTATPRICDHEELQHEIFGVWKPEDVILILNWWGAGAYIPNPSLPDSTVCRRACHAGAQDMFQPSKKALRHVDAYLAAHLNGVAKVKVAVMLRSEWIYLALHRNDLGIMKYCLYEAVKAVHVHQGENVKELPFVTADVGRYGSSGQKQLTLEENLAVQATVEKLNGYSMKYSEWEDSFTDVTGGITDRGYIAMLQKTIASRADCLVILGGGSFPLQGLHEYIDQHPDPSSWCIHLVCLGLRFREEYDDVLRSRSGQRVKVSWSESTHQLYNGVFYH